MAASFLGSRKTKRRENKAQRKQSAAKNKPSEKQAQ
jgi:hypothetical protein